MLAGRSREHARLDRLVANARAGTSEVLIVLGGPGTGKTDLCEYACEQAAGLSVLRCRGVESESELAYAALGDLFRPFV